MVESTTGSHADAVNKIGVCHIVYGGAWAGVEVQVTTLLKTLNQSPEVELCAILFGKERLAEELARLRIPTKVVSRGRTRWLGGLRDCVQFLRERRVDILHSHQHRENFLSVFLGRFAGVPILVQTQHGHPELFSGLSGMKRRILLSGERLTAKYAVDKVIAVSAEVTRYLRTYLPAKQVEVVRNGIEVGKVLCNLSSAEAKSRLGLRADSLVVGTAARLESVKRLDLFLSVAEQLSRSLPETMFVIAGKGREEARLRQLIKQHRLENRVVMLGHRDDVHQVLRAMDVLLITSDREGIPMVVLEAMVLGLPVVARDVGGISEILEHGTTGMLVPSGDVQALTESCLMLLNDRGMRTRVAQNAQAAVAKNYSAEANAAQTLRLYRSLVLSRQHRRAIGSGRDVECQSQN
jgi:glycosyltransferase involved in cell wall biosynthesis